MIKNTSLLARELAPVIRAGTEYELEDARQLASLLEPARRFADEITFVFCFDLFVAVAINTAHKNPDATLSDVFNRPFDFYWDSEKEMLKHFGRTHAGFVFHKTTEQWLARFRGRSAALDESNAQQLVWKTRKLWEKALDLRGNTQAQSPARPSAKRPKSVQIFNPDEISRALERLEDMREDKRSGGDRVLDNASRGTGHRLIPNAKKATERLDAAKELFENLEAPLSRLQVDLALSSAMAPNDFHVTPILLLGDPGVGKTYLATQLADALGVSMAKISAGGAQGAFQLNGSHSSWSHAKWGSLIELLAKGDLASPVVVIDEVDKIGDSRTAPVLPALLDLLEVRTARHFKDEFFEVEFDCSRMIFILTANEISNVPAPLLSRVNVFDVPRPSPEQRQRIIQSEIKKWQKKTKRPEINFDLSACNQLAERVDLDLRKTTDLVREGFGRAICDSSAVAMLHIPKSEGRTIGF
jgi:ATP-dependent Lon protease